MITASPDALVVSAADKLHNARAVLADYRSLGDELWKRFNEEASKQDHLDFYRALVTAFGATAAPRVMVTELDRVVTELEHLATQPRQSGKRFGGGTWMKPCHQLPIPDGGVPDQN